MAELDLKAGVSFSNTNLRRNWLCLSSACTVHRQPVCTGVKTLKLHVGVCLICSVYLISNFVVGLSLGAVDELGDMPYYAEHCAAMFAVTFSSGQGMQRNIVSTKMRQL